MTSLKKIIRPGLMRHFLNKAIRLAGQECSIAILVDGKPVVAVGKLDADQFSISDPDMLLAEISLGNGHSGQLGLHLNNGDITVEQGDRLLEFLSFTLQGFVDLEIARRSIADEALSKYRELALLHRSVSQFNTSLRLRDVVRSLLNECRRGNYPGEKGAVFLHDAVSMELRLVDHFGFTDLHALAAVKDSELFREASSSCKGEIINDLSRDSRWKKDIPGIKAILILPIASPNKCEGVLLLAAEKEGPFEAAHRKSLSTMASVAGISVSNAFNFEDSQTLMDAILQALAEAIDSRDPFTAGHSRRVAQLAAALALTMNQDTTVFRDTEFTDEEIRELYYSGILHDIGKIGIKEEVLTKDSRLPDKALEIVRARMEVLSQVKDFEWEDAFERIERINKAMTPPSEELTFVRSLSEMKCEFKGTSLPLLKEDERDSLLLDYGNLTPEERLEIQRHPAESERILQHIPLGKGFKNMLTIIRQHHERLDGSGYPDGLCADDILLQSRMLAIVDVYDAITQERHYKPASSTEEALSIISMDAEAGKLDESLCSFFSSNIRRIEQMADTIDSQHESLIFKIERLSVM